MPTLLIVDEEPSANRLKEVLEEVGFACSATGKADEAERLLAQRKPDLLLLDPHLEFGRPGCVEHLELIDVARRVSPSTKICVLCADPDALSKAKTLGADACFDKMTPLEEVLQTLKALSP